MNECVNDHLKSNNINKQTALCGLRFTFLAEECYVSLQVRINLNFGIFFGYIHVFRVSKIIIVGSR